MAFFERHLIFWRWLDRARLHSATALLTVLSLCCFAHAQPAAAPKPPAIFRTLALGSNVSDLFYDSLGKPVPITAGASGFSAPHLAPKNGRLELYRELPPATPEGKPRRTIVATLQLGEGGPYLVFMVTGQQSPSQTNALVVDDSWEEHPARTMRVFNFSQRRALVKVGETVSEIAPSQSRLFTWPDGNQARLQVATREAGGWVLRAGGPQLTPPHSRSSVILLDQQPSEDRPVTDELLVRNLIDSEPPAPAQLARN